MCGRGIRRQPRSAASIARHASPRAPFCACRERRAKKTIIPFYFTATIVSAFSRKAPLTFADEACVALGEDMDTVYICRGRCGWPPDAFPGRGTVWRGIVSKYFSHPPLLTLRRTMRRLVSTAVNTAPKEPSRFLQLTLFALSVMQLQVEPPSEQVFTL
ncbi:hypothetical protein MRX96_032176 [Rhipicephalus microplus]